MRARTRRACELGRAGRRRSSSAASATRCPIDRVNEIQQIVAFSGRAGRRARRRRHGQPAGRRHPRDRHAAARRAWTNSGLHARDADDHHRAPAPTSSRSSSTRSRTSSSCPTAASRTASPLHALSSKMIGVCRLDDGLVYLLDVDRLLAHGLSRRGAGRWMTRRASNDFSATRRGDPAASRASRSRSRRRTTRSPTGCRCCSSASATSGMRCEAGDVREIFQELRGDADSVRSRLHSRRGQRAWRDPLGHRPGAHDAAGHRSAGPDGAAPPAMVIANDAVATALVVDEIGDIVEVANGAVEPPVSIIDRAQAEFVVGIRVRGRPHGRAAQRRAGARADRYVNHAERHDRRRERARRA